MPSPQWSAFEFGQCQLHDPRRTRRLLTVAAALAQNPGGTLPQALPEWAEVKAAYRLLDQPELTLSKICSPHWLRTRALCAQPGCHLFIEDTTTLDFTSHHALQDVGRIGDDRGRGLLLHSTLALRLERWAQPDEPLVTVVGLAAQQVWARPEQSTRGARKDGEKKKRRLTRSRESQRWARSLSQCACPSATSQCIYLADRESDIYEVFGHCTAAKFDFVIRANQARALAGEDRSLFGAVGQAQLLGQITVSLRARAGQPARQAVLELRACAVRLRGPWRPGGAPAPFPVNVVEAREIHPPTGAVPICWVLLTSLPVETGADAQKVVALYTQRWLIEEYHKALKSGTQIESSQLEKRRRVEALLGILALVALRLLNTKLVARAQPDSLVSAQEIGPEVLQLLTARYGRPKSGWTQRQVLVCIARLGGFLARRSDGEPGWQTIWRGWHRLMIMIEGASYL